MCWRLEERRLNLSASTWKFRVQSFIIVLMKIEASACRVVSHSNQMNINLHNYDVVRFKRISTPGKALQGWMNIYGFREEVIGKQLQMPQKSWNRFLQLLPHVKIPLKFPWKIHRRISQVDEKVFLSVDILSAFLSLRCLNVIPSDISSINVSRNNKTSRAAHRNLSENLWRVVPSFFIASTLTGRSFPSRIFSIVWIAQKREENNLHCWRGNCLKFMNFSWELMLQSFITSCLLLLCSSLWKLKMWKSEILFLDICWSWGKFWKIRRCRKLSYRSSRNQLPEIFRSYFRELFEAFPFSGHPTIAESLHSRLKFT